MSPPDAAVDTAHRPGTPLLPIEERRKHLNIDASWRRNRFTHIPGDDGLPLFGTTFSFLRDQIGWSRELGRKYGKIYRNHTFFKRSVTVGSADAALLMLRDKRRIFSSETGWDGTIGRYFARGLMLRDFDDHRLHRRTMQEAFKKPALRAYLAMMNPLIAEQVASWPVGEQNPFYPMIKQLTLDIAGVVFTGMPPGPQLLEANRAFVDVMKSIFALVRADIPGTARWRGTRGRRYLDRLFRGLIPDKRESEESDLLAWMCRSRDEHGQTLTDDEIVDHMIFLMMAAHDTTTSALTNIVWALGAHPEWQERLREQVLAVDRADLEWEDLEPLGDIALVLMETLRLNPPVSFIPRMLLEECEIEGARVPKGAVVWLDVFHIHRDPAHWTDPETFDPERFSEERAEHKRHAGQYIPYSSGAHICLGMHFSIIQVKAVINQILRRYRIVLPDDYVPKQQLLPFPKPSDDLPVTFQPYSP